MACAAYASTDGGTSDLRGPQLARQAWIVVRATASLPEPTMFPRFSSQLALSPLPTERAALRSWTRRHTSFWICRSRTNTTISIDKKSLLRCKLGPTPSTRTLLSRARAPPARAQLEFRLFSTIGGHTTDSMIRDGASHAARQRQRRVSEPTAADLCDGQQVAGNSRLGAAAAVTSLGNPIPPRSRLAGGPAADDESSATLTERKVKP
jgi:hypothetical protein